MINLVDLSTKKQISILDIYINNTEIKIHTSYL